MDATPTLEIPYAEINDPADAAELTEAMSTRIETILKDYSPSRLAASDPGKLLVVSGTGRSAFVAMSGDISIGASGATQIGNKKVVRANVDDFAIGAGQLDADSVTRSKFADSSFQTKRAFTDAIAPNGFDVQDIVWDTPFADTNYTFSLSTFSTEVAVNSIRAFVKDRFKLSVVVTADTGLGLTGYVELNAIASHD